MNFLFEITPKDLKRLGTFKLGQKVRINGEKAKKEFSPSLHDLVNFVSMNPEGIIIDIDPIHDYPIKLKLDFGNNIVDCKERILEHV